MRIATARFYTQSQHVFRKKYKGKKEEQKTAVLAVLFVSFTSKS